MQFRLRGDARLFAAKVGQVVWSDNEYPKPTWDVCISQAAIAFRGNGWTIERTERAAARYKKWFMGELSAYAV